MPKYYIDLQDGNDFFEDDVGSSLETIDVARFEAAHLVSLRAYDIRPAGKDREFIATVRDENGIPLHRATLTIRLERLDQEASIPELPDVPSHPLVAADAAMPTPLA